MLFQQRSHPTTWYHHLVTRLGALTLLALTLFLAACGGSSTPSTTTGSTTTCPSTKSLTGAGSSFDYPLFSKMFSVYSTVKCGANVDYQSIGSGAGINIIVLEI